MQIISNNIKNILPRRVWYICPNTVIPPTWFCGPPCPLPKGVLFEDVALRTEVMESTTLSADVMESITPITEVMEDRCFEVLVTLNPVSLA